MMTSPWRASAAGQTGAPAAKLDCCQRIVYGLQQPKHRRPSLPSPDSLRCSGPAHPNLAQSVDLPAKELGAAGFPAQLGGFCRQGGRETGREAHVMRPNSVGSWRWGRLAPPSRVWKSAIQQQRRRGFLARRPDNSRHGAASHTALLACVQVGIGDQQLIHLRLLLPHGCSQRGGVAVPQQGQQASPLRTAHLHLPHGFRHTDRQGGGNRGAAVPLPSRVAVGWRGGRLVRRLLLLLGSLLLLLLLLSWQGSKWGGATGDMAWKGCRRQHTNAAISLQGSNCRCPCCPCRPCRAAKPAGYARQHQRRQGAAAASAAAQLLQKAAAAAHCFHCCCAAVSGAAAQRAAHRP